MDGSLRLSETWKTKGGTMARQVQVRRFVAIAAALLIPALFLAACGSDSSSSNSGSDSGGGGKKVALLLPESKTARYETQDRPLFQKKVKALCPNCEIIYGNADQDAAKQQSQAEAALTNGADVLVLDPVDSESAVAIVNKAAQQKVPVVSYDRIVNDVDLAYYISYDNEKVGQLQAQALLDKLDADGKQGGSIVMINGAPSDNNAKLFKKGAHTVFDASSYKIAAEYDTPDWSADKAQEEMEQAITKLGKDGFVGVYAANDGTAGGAIAAMKGAGISPIRPTTGQDAELAGIQRILAGEQYMTVYKAINPEAADAATVAVALAKGQPVPADLINRQTDNGKIEVPSKIFDPVAVTKDNVKSTIVADKFWTVAQICTADFKAACQAAGIS
jgi:D-xylose transport system substrate-binding protein